MTRPLLFMSNDLALSQMFPKMFKPEKYTRLLELPVFYSVFCLYNKNNTFKQALMELTAPCFTVVEKASMAESTNQSCNN